MVAGTVYFRPLGLIQDAQGDTRFESKVYSLNQDTHGLIEDASGLSKDNAVQFSTSTVCLLFKSGYPWFETGLHQDNRAGLSQDDEAYIHSCDAMCCIHRLTWHMLGIMVVVYVSCRFYFVLWIPLPRTH
jgi:hypothetical protein